MEVGYKSIFVKKFSRGNSYAIENDVENKRYKIKFINKYSAGILLILLILAFFASIVFLIFAMKPERKENRSLSYQWKPRNVVLFHKDEPLLCDGPCIKDEGIKKEYFEKLKESLKKEGYKFLDIDTVFSGDYDSITKLELKAIVDHLIDIQVLLNEKFEVPTIVKFKKFNKEFKRDVANEKEYKKRYKNFRKNRIMIETHNSDPNRLYTMGYTQAADIVGDGMNVAILEQYPLKYMKDDFTQASTKEDRFNESGIIFDWRKKGHVVPIRDQGKCGSCWAFCTADLISSMVSIKTNVLKIYSTQQLNDCVYPIFNCMLGGSAMLAIEYVKIFNYCTEEEYPYQMKDYACSQPNKCKDKVEIKDVLSLKKGSLEDYLEEDGPFILTMDASKEFMFYKEGIFDGECEKNVNHGVLVVGHGYDKEKDAKYWIVKNSWSKDWGEDGYFRLLNAHKMVWGRKSYFCKMNKRSMGISLK